MRLTERQLNRTTLERQMLLRREPIGVADAVSRIVALQAQEPASPYVALWNRITDLDPAAVDAEFSAGTIVKASLVRLTLHVVHASDHPAIHLAMVPSLRASRLHDRRFTDTGLTHADADALLPGLLEFLAVPRTGAAVEEHLAQALGRHEQRLWWAMRMFSPVRHVPTGAPWSFGARASYVAATGMLEAEDRPAALSHLVLRYLAAFGPATAADIAQFSILRAPVVREILTLLTGRVVEHVGPEGETLYDVPGAQISDADVAAPPRLLGMWESSLLAYADRRRVLADDHRSVVIRRNGDVLASVLVDGHVAGVWRHVDGAIEVTAFHPLSVDAWSGLDAEARALLAFVGDRDAAVYGRCGHWWDKGLSGTEMRRLGT